jgi:hypothetical protein
MRARTRLRKHKEKERRDSSNPISMFRGREERETHSTLSAYNGEPKTTKNGDADRDGN